MTIDAGELGHTLIWRRPTEILLTALLVTAVVLGGTGQIAAWQILVICAVAALLLPVAIAAGALQRFASLPILLRGVAVGIVLLPLAQLIPLPPAVWQALPDRELAKEIFALLGTSGAWRGISLVPRETLFGFLMLLAPAAVFLASLILDRQGRRRIVWWLLGLITISAFLGFIQFATKGTVLDIYGTAHRGSLLGFFANRNHEGLLMAIGAAFAISAIERRIRNPRLAIATSAIAGMVFFIAAIGTLSRAGIGLTGFSIIAVFYVCFVHGKLRWPIIAGGAIAAILTLYFLTFSSTVQSALDRFSQIEENGRQEIWHKTSPLIEQFMPWGAGLGSFTSVYPVVEKLEDINPRYFNRVHNEYLELLIEFGLPGIAILALFAFLFGKRIVEGLRSRDTFGAFALPAGVSILLIGVHSIVDYPLRTQSHAVIFALACGFFLVVHQRRDGLEEPAVQIASWGDRTTQLRALSLIGQFGVLIAFALFVTYQRSVTEVFDQSGTNLVNAEGVAMSPSRLAQAKRTLSRQPLDQALLNTIYASEVRSGLDEGKRQEYVSVLERLGWRDTTTQQNLLFEAARRNDIESALDHMDALLRREKLVEQIMPLLAQLEVDPSGMQFMAERLAANPGWRERYLSFYPPLAKAEILDARMRLLDFMKAQGFPIDRSEMRAPLRALMSSGRRDEVVRIARQLMSPKEQGQLVYDPEFDRLNDVPQQERGAALPFEWEHANRSGITTQIITDPWSSRLIVRWNGRGAPTVARTMTFLTEGQRPELEVRLSPGSQLRGLESLRFSLICPGKKETLFVRRAAGNSASPGMGRSSAYYEAEGGVACDYPQFYMGGRPRVGNRGADLSIDAVKLTLP